MNESITSGSDSYWKVPDECTLQRSLSVPASCRKNGNYKLATENGLLNGDSSWNKHQNLNQVRPNRNWYRGGKLFLGRKGDVRVSKIDPDHVNLTSEMIHKLESSGNQPNGYQDPCKLSKSMNNQQSVSNNEPLQQFDASKCQNPNGILRMFQGGVRRISSLSERHGRPSSYVIKKVEIMKQKEERLGIYIKKRKVLSKLRGNDSFSHGIFVTRLDSSCQAARNGLLKPGDQVLAVNDIPIMEPDVKKVASMMDVPKHLILTIRTSQRNSSSNDKAEHAVSYEANGNQIFRSQLSDVPEESTDILANSQSLKTKGKGTCNTLPSVKTLPSNCKLSTFSGVYDNEGSNRNDVEDTSVSAQNSVLIKFDESYQILLNAIACCEKPNNLQSIENSTNSSIHRSFSAFDKFSGLRNADNFALIATKPLESSSVTEDTLVVADPYNDSLKVLPGIASPCAYGICFGKNVAIANNEPDYDDVPISDTESSSLSACSGNEEFNVDAFVQNMEGNDAFACQVIHGNESGASVSSSSSAVSTSSAEMQHFPNSSKHESSSYSKELSLLKQSFSDVECENKKTMHLNTPKFPVAHTDLTSNAGMPSYQTQSMGITVDKKRQWLHRGQQVSDELQMRLEGLNMPSRHQEISTSRVSPDKSLPNGYLHPINGFNSSKIISAKLTTKPRSRRRTSESSASSGVSSGSPGFVANDVQIGENPVDISQHKSTSEKSAKSLFSVSTPTSGKQMSKSSSSGLVTKMDSSSTKVSDGRGAVGGSYDPVQQTSMAINGNDVEGSLNHGKSSETAKITSPSRSRRSNWKKITKRFRIGSSENTVSDYACWNVEEPQDSSPLAATTRVSAQHPIQRRIDKPDSTLLNRYHLDISMAHQRRISRQLLLGNSNQDPSVKALALSQFRKHKPLPVLNSLFLPAVDGCLVITLYGVRELKKTLCEAYCLVQVDTASTKRIGTTMQTCRGAVVWNQCFEMTVSKARDLHLTLYTWDTRGGKHKKYSYATLNLPTLLQGRKPETPFAERLAIRLEPKGTLYVKIALEENPSSPGPLVFGADLQSIVDREKSGLSVPTLVHACIEEVEKRGSQVVGIYRLCGSAIVKKELRKKLEASNTGTSLSAEHYPDVNVITGILKDFLRELPQPLFPPELLEAVTTAMEKNPGPSPAVVVKEPFAPNPCLTSPGAPAAITDAHQKERTDALLQHIKQLPAAPAERATLFALLNHLKKVAMHSTQNKMTCQNLAVCFGPVLLGPVNAGQRSGIDLSAAIGFKRHIQVLNYMLSNWPDTPVEVPVVKERALNNLTEEENGQSANRMSCVSLTRRLSRVFVLEENEVSGECDASPSGMGKRVSANRRESLDSILESDHFADPLLDMYKAKPPEEKES